MKEPTFEENLDRLEEIVQLLEDGNLGLEKSLELFEEGVRISQLCSAKLDQAEKRVQQLTKSEDGRVELTPFSEREE